MGQLFRGAIYNDQRMELEITRRKIIKLRNDKAFLNEADLCNRVSHLSKKQLLFLTFQLLKSLFTSVSVGFQQFGVLYKREWDFSIYKSIEITREFELKKLPCSNMRFYA